MYDLYDDYDRYAEWCEDHGVRPSEEGFEIWLADEIDRQQAHNEETGASARAQHPFIPREERGRSL